MWTGPLMTTSPRLDRDSSFRTTRRAEYHVVGQRAFFSLSGTFDRKIETPRWSRLCVGGRPGICYVRDNANGITRFFLALVRRIFALLVGRGFSSRVFRRVSYFWGLRYRTIPPHPHGYVRVSLYIRVVSIFFFSFLLHVAGCVR